MRELIKEKLTFFVLGIALFATAIFGIFGKKENGGQFNRLIANITLAQKPRELDVQILNKSQLQDLNAFSNYEPLAKKSAFFKRKPDALPEGEQAQQAPEAEVQPAYLYKGEILLNNKLSVVLLNQKNNKTVFLAKGESVDGYELKEMDADEILLVKSDQEKIKIRKKAQITPVNKEEEKN
jgi:hypothetical protein